MNKFISKILYGLIVVEVIGLIMLGIKAYFMMSYSPTEGIIRDGLGRILYKTPFIVRFALGEERMWPGFGWFAIDFIIFWSCCGIGYGLFQAANRLSDTD